MFPIGSMYAIYGNIYHQYTPFMLAYIYSQVQAGPLGDDCRTPPGVLESFSHGKCHEDQLHDVRTLEVCFEGVLESYYGKSVL